MKEAAEREAAAATQNAGARRRAHAASPHRSRPVARIARQKYFGVWYSYAGAWQETPKGGVYLVGDEQTNQQPAVWVAGSHSIGQLWAEDNRNIGGGASTVEEGWTEAPGQYPDVLPHLFVAMSDGGVYPEGGYVGSPAIGWVQVSPSVYPNMAVTHDDTVHKYSVENRNNNWWVYYDGIWFGYMPGSNWPKHFPNLTRVEFGGEVETPEFTTCTDMGNSLFGTQANSATVTYTYWFGKEHTAVSNFGGRTESDGGAYNDGQWIPSHTNPYGFHYGGPGWC